MLKILALFISFSVIITSHYRDFADHNRLKVHFLDVGQGDAILIVTPDNKYILVDGGVSGTQLLEQLGSVMPFWERKIDYVVASHGDADHITGLVDISERFQVGQFQYNGKHKDTLTYSTLVQNFEETGVPIKSIDENDDFQIGCCVWIDYLWPKLNSTETLSDNDASVAMIVDYSDFEIYLAGDLSAEYEEEAVKALDIDIELLKASHHGSKSSTSINLLEKLSPDISVLSVGKDNKYGHPHPEVLEMFKEKRLKTFRTDESGTISIKSDGEKFWAIGK